MRGKVALVAGLALVLVTVAGTSLAQEEEAPASEGTDDITFYGHVFGFAFEPGPFTGPNPANTEFPSGETNFGIGTSVNCQDVGPAIPGTPATEAWESCQDEEFNKVALFSTAGPVDVQNRAEFVQNGGYSQLHNERGQTKPILLDTGGQITADVYGTLDLHGWFIGAGNPYGTNCHGPHAPGVPCLYPYWGWDPGVHEDVIMEATLYHADLGARDTASEAPPVRDAWLDEEATVIAEGQWGPDQVVNGVPGSPNAFHWEVDLGAPQVDEIPRSDDFFLVYNVYQAPGGNDLCADCPMRWWSGEFFPPTFQLPVENAFTVERAIPNFANAKLAVLGILNTPWGSYDVDQDTVEIEIEGPQGTISPEKIETYADFSVAHGGHFDPINITWIWDYRADDAPAGDYAVTVAAENLQNSAKAACTATFSLERAEESLVPGEAEPARCGIQGIQTEEKVEQVTEEVNETGS